MNGRTAPLKTKCRVITAQLIVFFSLAMGATTTHAQNSFSDTSEMTSGPNIHTWELILLAELPVVFYSGVASQAPEFAGALILGSSAFSYDKHHNVFGNILSGGSTTALGLMNMQELKKSKYSRTDVFISNVVGLHAKIFIERLLNKGTWQKDNRLDVQLRIHPNNYFLGYRYVF